MRVLTIPTLRPGYEGRSYVLVDEATRACAVIDPDLDGGAILKIIEEEKLVPEYILVTHGHYDHMMGCMDIKAKHAVPLCIHALDAGKLTDPVRNLSMGIGQIMTQCPPDRCLEDGEVLPLGELEIEVIHVPGHSEGGCAFRCGDVVFSGDTLFWNSVGRWDFPGGNKAQLFESIATRLMTLPEDTVVYPGHFGPTTIGREKRFNPYAGVLK